MVSEWSVECSADDPVLVVPWSDPSNPDRHFIDLRENPYDLDHLPEAEQYPPLMHALRALNASRSPVFTAKCDAWPIDEGDELDRLRLELDHPYAMLDCVLRPAMIDLTGPQEGFAISLYVKALGHDAQSAEENWAAALKDVAALLRTKDLALALSA